MVKGTIEQETLAWYRPTIRGKVVRAWAQAFGLVLLGATTLGLLRVKDVDFGNPWLAVYAAGMLLVLSGPLWLATRLSKLLGRERCLLFERAALVWLEGERSVRRIPWVDIATVAVRGESLVIHSDQQDLELPARFEDITPEALASAIMDLRRRALMGLPMRVPAPTLLT